MPVKSNERLISLPAVLVEELLDTLIVSSRRRLNVEERQLVTDQIRVLKEKLESPGRRMAFSAKFVSGVLRILWYLVSEEAVFKRLLNLLLGK